MRGSGLTGYGLLDNTSKEAQELILQLVFLTILF